MPRKCKSILSLFCYTCENFTLKAQQGITSAVKNTQTALWLFVGKPRSAMSIATTMHFLRMMRLAEQTNISNAFRCSHAEERTYKLL